MASSLNTLLPKKSLIFKEGGSECLGRRLMTSDMALARRWGALMKNGVFWPRMYFQKGGSLKKQLHFFSNTCLKMGVCA